jgi:hypothetical protein
MLEARHALFAYLRTRKLAATLRTRADIERHHRRFATAVSAKVLPMARFRHVPRTT